MKKECDLCEDEIKPGETSYTIKHPDDNRTICQNCMTEINEED